MVFPSVPSYLDPPNWQQPPGVITSENHHHTSQLPPPGPQSGGGGADGIRPVSMTERARLAKIPHPESALKCPRCESSNTKFCYYNNYNLSQPRHFCKTCRRYWTLGGALRNVPVGGGCRRNKRSKGRKSSKSPSVTSEPLTGSMNSSDVTTIASNSCTDKMLGHVNPLLTPVHYLGDYNPGDIGLNFGAIQAQLMHTGGETSGRNMDFQIGTSSNGVGSMLTDWRSVQQVQQFPILTSLDQPQTGLYSFENEAIEPPNYQQLRSKPLESTITVSSAVKIEETPWLNSSRNFVGISGNDQYWLGGGGGGNQWTDLSGFIKEKSDHR